MLLCLYAGGMERPLPPTPNQAQSQPRPQSDRQIQNLPGMHSNLAKNDVSLCVCVCVISSTPEKMVAMPFCTDVM